MANATVFDSTLTNPGGTGSTITVTLPTHAVGDIIYISIGNTGNTLWTGNPAGWNRIQQVQVGTATTGLLGTWFWRKVVSGDSLPLASPVFTLGATVSRMAIARSVRGADLESPFVLPEWVARAYNTGTANPVRPTAITTPAPETLILHDYFSKAATNAPDPSGYTQDEEIIISGTLVGNGAEKTVASQQTDVSSQDASPTSGVRWAAGILAIPLPDYVYYRAGSQALTASGTSATPALPTGTSSSDNRGNKDLVIATIEVAGTPTVSPQVGADWTEIATWANTTSGNGSTVKKYWSLYDGSLNTQFNRSTTGEIFVYLSTYRNTKQTNPIGTSAVQQNASSTTSAFPSLARTSTKVNMQATCVADATPTYTSPATWTERNDSNGVTCADLPFNAAGTVSSASFTLSAGSPTLAGLTEIKSVASVVEFNRTALVDAAGAVVVAGTFFTIFTRTALIGTTGAVTVSGVRIVSRTTSVDATGSIAASGIVVTPASTVERSAAVNVLAAVSSGGEFLSVFDRTSAVNGSAAIAASSVFFSIFERSTALSGAGTISSTALFFSILERSSGVGVSADISSAVLFFTVFERAGLVEGVGSITVSATFFTVFNRSSLIDSIGSIASVGVRDLLRTASIDANGTIASTPAFFSVFNGSAAIDGSATIASSSAFFSVLSAAAIVNTSASINLSATFLSIVNGAATIDALGSIETSAIFFTAFNRESALGVLGSINSSGIFFSISFGANLIDGVGAIESSGETQAGGAEIERSVSCNVVGQISCSGFGILQRSSIIAVSANLSVSAEFFSVFEARIEVVTLGGLATAGQRELLRTCEVQGQGQIDAQGTSTQHYEASLLITGTGVITVSGTVVTSFHPRKVFNSSPETRILSVSREGRTVLLSREPAIL